MIMAGPEIVKLDVGGTEYKTTRTTLMQCTYFNTMFSGHWEVNTEENGCIFVDRDGKLFAYVLAFLRGNTMLPDDTNLLKTLGQEAEFYGIDSLSNCISFKLGDNDCVHVRIDTQPVGLTQRIIQRKTLLSAIENGFHELFATGQPKDVDFRLLNSFDITPYAADMWVILLDAFLFGKAGLMFTDDTTPYRLKQVIAFGKRWGVPAATLQCIADQISEMKLRDLKRPSTIDLP